MRHIIVDGYNVIRADTRLQSLERTSLELARETLARTLASSPRLAHDTIIVVFDGRFGDRSHVHSSRLGRIEMVYSARGQTADEVIVQHARSLTGSNVIVVTNDVEVRERCRAEGCDVSSSENLLGQIPGGGNRRPAQADEDRDPTLSTVKRGNPRRSSKKSRQQRDIRF